jgi:hypothetical protein
MKILDTAQANYFKMMELTDHPDCFRDQKQFKVWKVLEDIAHTKPRSLPCRDCTPEYHQQMSDEDRCANSKVINIMKIMPKAST